jgi:hypothetical protein
MRKEHAKKGANSQKHGKPPPPYICRTASFCKKYWYEKVWEKSSTRDAVITICELRSG